MPGKGWFVILHLYLTAVGAIITIVETIEGSQLAWSDLHTARRSTASAAHNTRHDQTWLLRKPKNQKIALTGPGIRGMSVYDNAAIRAQLLRAMVASSACSPIDPARRRAVARRAGARGTRRLPLRALWLAIRPASRLPLPAGNDTTGPYRLLPGDYSCLRRCWPHR